MIGAIIGVFVGVFAGGVLGVTTMCILQVAKGHFDIDLIFNNGQNRIVQTHSGSISVYEITQAGWKELYHTYTDPMNHIELIDFGKLIAARIKQTEEKIK